MLQRLGKFEILERLGEGAMGEVFLAKDTTSGREVALKLIRSDAARAMETRERFFREAKAVVQLCHPSVVNVHEFGDEEGILFIAMEYIPGEDLATLIQRRELRPTEVLDLLAQVCEALGFAHQERILHRDVKPSNILVTRVSGHLMAKLTDFGVAHITGSDLSGSDTLLGAFGYMAPEYIRTGKPDSRSDLFSMGVVLYESLTGSKPFQGDTTATILYRVIHEEPAPIDLSMIPSISPAILMVLQKALAKDPELRYQSGEAMAQALRSAKDPAWTGLEHDLEATDRPELFPMLTSPMSTSTKTWLFILAVLAAFVAGFLVWRQ